MKTLIAYYSFTNNNAKLAAHLQKQLNCDIVRIETVGQRNSFSIFMDWIFKRKPRVKPLNVSLSDYDHILFLAPIWAGKIAAPIRSFLTDERQNIRSYSFISLCGGGSPKQILNVQEELSSVVGKPASKVLELWINDLLPVENRNTIKYTSGFRIEEDGFGQFEDQIRKFIESERLAREEKVKVKNSERSSVAS